MLGETVKGARALNMSVVCRVDPHAMSEEAYAAHPEWAACTADGKPRRHWAAADMWVTCQNGGFYFDFMPAVLKEITELYQADGFFGNRWAGSGMCYCETCRTKFRAATGLELPTSDDPQEPRRKAYILWNQQMRSAQFALWNEAAKARNKDCFFSPNGGMNDPNTVIIPIVAVDRQGRSGTTPVWMMGKYAKQVRAYMQNLPVCGLFNVGIEDTNRWKDSVQRGPELEAWAHSGIAQGFRPWFCKFNARVFDPRWVAPVTKIYQWHHANDRYLRNTANLARVSQQRAKLGKDFIQLSGEDATALGFMAHGGHGCISVVANVAPKLCADLMTAVLKGDYATGLKIQDRLVPLHDAIFKEPGLAGAKHGLKLLGRIDETVRLPLMPVTAPTGKIIRDAMVHAGLLN